MESVARKPGGDGYRPGYEVAAEKILAFIASSGLQEGARMPTEQGLSEQLHVSRTMIREAIKTLAANGYVQTRRGSGIFVGRGDRSLAMVAINFSMPLDPEHIRELLEFRCLLEMQTARLAAKQITVSQLRILEQNVHLNRQAAKSGQKDIFLKHDDAFHQSIAEAAHNTFLIEAVMSVLRLQRHAIMILTNDDPGSLLTSAEHHIAIFNAIKDGYAEEAAQAMKEHIASVIIAYQQAVRRRLLQDLP